MEKLNAEHIERLGLSELHRRRAIFTLPADGHLPLNAHLNTVGGRFRSRDSHISGSPDDGWYLSIVFDLYRAGGLPSSVTSMELQSGRAIEEGASALSLGESITHPAEETMQQKSPHVRKRRTKHRRSIKR